jgi:hypothetical protein
MRTLVACAVALFAPGALAATTLDDPTFYLLDEVYQTPPRRLAQWESGQIARTGNVWIDLGSVEHGEYDAIERGVVNLELASRFSLHGEIRNDRDPDGRVTRAVADLLVNVAPGLWLGASGVPAARKQDYGVGGSVLLASASRTRYLLARLVADQFLYNRTNVDNGTRASPVLHPQVEGRWEDGAWSLAGFADVTTESETSFPSAPLVTFEAASRRELSLHARYALPGWELDARLELRRIHRAQTQLGAASALRQSVATVRFDALFPAIAGTRWRPRLGVRALTGEANTDDAGVASTLTRREPGGRIAASRDGATARWEVGYAFAVPVLRRTGAAAADAAPYEDVVYGSSEVSLGLISLRALLSWEVREARFGGANANVLLQF